MVEEMNLSTANRRIAARSAVEQVLLSLWRDIGNGSLRLYNDDAEVYFPD